MTTHRTDLRPGRAAAIAAAVGIWLSAALIVLGRVGFHVGPLRPTFLHHRGPHRRTEVRSRPASAAPALR